MDQQVAHPQVALPGVPAVGEVLAEKYRVEGILGVGGMGVVLGARHLQLGQVVAIKVLSVGGDKQADSVERFLREGRAAAALNSDHVVRIYDVGQLPTGLPFMVMERLRGQDLSSVLTATGPLPIDEAVEYVAQATMAIVEAHEVGIVHRDLKPANLFLTQRSDGTACIKVLDFGISKQVTDLETQTLQGSLTSTRQVMGSPAYMSPEQVRDAKTVDHRTDIWALGVTLYELLTQHVAFDADTLPAVCAAIVADPPVPLLVRRPEVPERIASIVHRCLEKQPAQRYPSARALLAALRAFQGKPVEPKAASHRKPPDTESSMSPHPGVGANLDRSAGLEWVESGPRAVDSHRRDGVDSQPRDRIDSQPRDRADGTLVSGRSPGTGLSPRDPALVLGVSDSDAGEGSPAAPSAKGGNSWNWRRRSVAVAGVFLVLGGATTGWYFRAGPREDRNPYSDGDIADRIVTQGPERIPLGTLQPAESGSKPITVTPATHFTLRIESNPSQALVIEGGNPLGVTPLTLEVDRTVVQKAPRQFLLRKEGFVEIGIQQGDALTDVQQNVTLVKSQPGGDGPASTTERRPPVGSTKSSPKVVTSTTSSAIPSGQAPGIRITR